MIQDNSLLQQLFQLYTQKKYYSIYKTIHYSNIFKQCSNRNIPNDSNLDTYLYTHTQTHIQHTINRFYAAIRVYRFIIKNKYTHPKEKNIINDTNLYGESIKDCKEHIIYLNADTTTYNSDNYYAFTYSELNKIITHALLFTFDRDHIISSHYPKHPLTNKKFTMVELEYILYQFKYHSLTHHKIIRMFQDSQFSLSMLNNVYGGEYMFILSSELYIKNLTTDEFKSLFQDFWRFIYFEYTHSHTNVKNRIVNKVCKHCILSIPDLQISLQRLLSHYRLFDDRKTLIGKRLYAKRAILYKNKFLDILSIYHPHVFKNKSYYHLHYNKYKAMRRSHNYMNKKKFMGSINLPIVDFTDDCKIIYSYNGQRCVRDKQVLVTI